MEDVGLWSGPASDAAFTLIIILITVVEVIRPGIRDF